MKTTKPNRPNPLEPERFKRRWLALLIALIVAAGLIASSGFQIYWSKERRLIVAADEIVAALKAYRDGSPGTAKEFPAQLQDLMRDPRMLSDTRYLTVLPVDPITLNQDWGVVRDKNNRVIGVHSLSNETPTLFARLLALRGGEKYAEWLFTAE